MPELRTEKEYKDYTSDIKLPNWLLEAFPEHKPWMIISWNERLQGFSVNPEDKFFKNIADAYDWAQKQEDYQTVLDESVHGHGGEYGNSLFFCDAEESANSGRLLISHTTEDTVNLLNYSYRLWLDEINPAYQADPDNWVAAFNWLNLHPMTWQRSKNEPTFDWRNEQGLADLHTAVWQDAEKNPEVHLEFGSHVEPHYTARYHDTRLDVDAPTFEEAYVILAARVNKYFNPDGTEREGIENDYSPNKKKWHSVDLNELLDGEK